MKNKKIDMLNGPLVGKIVIFALPLALSSILQQLFNSADLAVVGRFDSDKAMAAVGSNSSLVNLIVSLFLGLSVGENVVVARLIGQGRKASFQLSDPLLRASEHIPWLPPRNPFRQTQLRQEF